MFRKKELCLIYLFGWFLNVLVNYYVISRTGPKTERQTIERAATHETELGDHDFCLSLSKNCARHKWALSTLLAALHAALYTLENSW